MHDIGKPTSNRSYQIYALIGPLEIISYNILETIEASEDSYITACKREQYWVEAMCRRSNPLLNKTGMKNTKHRKTIVFFSGGVMCIT